MNQSAIQNLINKASQNREDNIAKILPAALEYLRTEHAYLERGRFRA